MELKDIVEIRPIYHWKDRRVKTHIFLCILAQVLVSKVIEVLKERGWLDERHSFKTFLSILSEIKIGLFEFEDASIWIINKLDEEQEKILKIFDMDLSYFKNPYKKFVV